MSGAGKKSRKPTSAYRKLRRKLSKTVLRTPQTWLQHRFLRPTDVFFASYPRSGTTWSRFTLFEILSGREAGFQAVEDGIRPVYWGRGLALLPGNGRLISTHEQYRREYKRAIYLVRDARDVALSEFAYTTALEFFRGDLDQFLETFLCGKISAFGPWQRHITSWLDSPIANTPNLLVLRFEDLRQNPLEGFTRMADFLGVNPGAERIQQAIANNRLDKMKEKERIEPRRASVKGEFVRSGAVQGWRSKLSPAQLQFIDQHAGSVLSRLGYARWSDVMAQESSPDPVLQTTPNLS
jgi:hypothetical protein